MVIEIFIPQRDAVDSLTNQVQLRMHDAILGPRIHQGIIQ